MSGEFGIHNEFIRDINDRSCDPITRSQCPRPKHFENTQHIYRPASEYTTEQEERFRNLGENTIEMCAYKHDIDDSTLPPPEKPSEAYMDWRLRVNAVHAAVRLRREMEGYE